MPCSVRTDSSGNSTADSAPTPTPRCSPNTTPRSSPARTVLAWWNRVARFALRRFSTWTSKCPSDAPQEATVNFWIVSRTARAAVPRTVHSGHRTATSCAGTARRSVSIKNSIGRMITNIRATFLSRFVSRLTDMMENMEQSAIAACAIPCTETNPMWGYYGMHEQAPTPMRSWFCQDCHREIKRGELDNEVCTCGCRRFAMQPKPHSWSDWKLTVDDEHFLRIQRIKPE